MVQSPDYESVDDGKCEREGVGGLLVDEPEVMTSGGVHKSVPHEIPSYKHPSLLVLPQLKPMFLLEN